MRGLCCSQYMYIAAVMALPHYIRRHYVYALWGDLSACGHEVRGYRCSTYVKVDMARSLRAAAIHRCHLSNI